MVVCFSVKVIQTSNFNVVLDLDKPRTGGLYFSPCNSLLATWEPYAGLSANTLYTWLSDGQSM